MPGRSRGYNYILMELTVDALAIVAGLLAAYWTRFHSGWILLRSDWNPLDYLRIFPVVVALWVFSLRLTHCYRNHPMVISFNISRRLLKGSMLAMVLMVALNHFSRLAEYSRLMYALSLLYGMAFLLAGRGILQETISRLLRGGIARSRVLIVGAGPLARRLAVRCRMHPEYGYEAIGFLSESPQHAGRIIEGIPVLGGPADLHPLIEQHGIHEVFVTQSNLPPQEYLRLMLESEQCVAQIRIVPNIVEMMTGDVYYDELAGIPLFALKETPLRGWNALGKRMLDFAISSILLTMLAPIFPLIAWLIRRDSPGPAFYRQKRLGADGREFVILKFRTMRTDAESSGAVWGGRDDPRCTSLGKFLRRWDLDELPQLWNVLRGDMSLVGPRPERPEFVNRFREIYPRYMARHRVLAGMTGWAQVHGLRGDTPIDDRLQYDLYYIENWSLWLDLKILLMTAFRLRGSAKAAALSSPATPATPVAAAIPAIPASPSLPAPRRAQSDAPIAPGKPAQSSSISHSPHSAIPPPSAAIPPAQAQAPHLNSPN